MSRPLLEVADLVRARNMLSSAQPPVDSLDRTLKCCWLLRAVAPLPLAAISMVLPLWTSAAISYNSCSNRHCPTVPDRCPRTLARSAPPRTSPHAYPMSSSLYPRTGAPGFAEQKDHLSSATPCQCRNSPRGRS